MRKSEKKHDSMKSNVWLKVGLAEPGTRVGYRQFFWHNISMLLGLYIDNENELEVQILLINTLRINLCLLSKQLAIQNSNVIII